MILSLFDHQQTAIINPGDVIQALPNFPKTAVTCFARETFARILAEVPHREIAKTSVANLEISIYELNFQGQKIAFFQLLCWGKWLCCYFRGYYCYGC